MKSEDSFFQSDRLSIRRQISKQQYTLLWSGESDFRDPTQTLSPCLNNVLGELRDRKLVLDFRELSFMNSSSVTPILAFVKTVCGKGMPVHLIYNSALSWQRTTASSMRALAHSLKLLTVELLTAEATPH